MKNGREPDTGQLDELDILFPKREVTIGEGVIVKVTPLPLSQLPKVMKTFGRVIFGYSDQLSTLKDADPSETIAKLEKWKIDLALTMGEELVELVGLCIDKPLSSLPHTVFPELVAAFFELNVTEDLVKKWQALLEKVKEKVGERQG